MSWLQRSYAGIRPALGYPAQPYHTPESVYFGVGKFEKDQVEDYAKRKDMDLYA